MTYKKLCGQLQQSSRRPSQTPAAKWQRERCFINYGTLKGIVTNLKRIGEHAGTSLSERYQLADAAASIQSVLQEWLEPDQLKHSKARYLKTKKRVK